MSKVSPKEKTTDIKTEIALLVGRVHELEAERIELIDKLESMVRENRPLIRGSLFEKAEKCRKKKCQQCKSGKYHPATFLSVSIGGKVKHRRVKVAEREEIEQGVGRYKDWLAKQKKLVELCSQQAEIVTTIRDGLLASITPPPQKPGCKGKK